MKNITTVIGVVGLIIAGFSSIQAMTDATSAFKQISKEARAAAEYIRDKAEAQEIQQLLPVQKKFPYQLGYVFYKDIHPGQSRYASKNVEQKIVDALKKGYARKAGRQGYILQFDEGRSALPEAAALPVVKGPKGLLVLADGHHDILANITLGAKTVPVKVIDDLSESTDFWKEAEKKGYVFLNNLAGERVIPPAIFRTAAGVITLEDDPNRYFAAISARKCDRRGQPVEESTGSEYPLWVKIGKELFIEFYLSDFMNKHGLMYSYDMGDQPSREFVNKVREALHNNPIKGLRLIEQETYYKDINKEDGGLCNLP